MGEGHKKRTVAYYTRLFNTNNPFTIADNFKYTSVSMSVGENYPDIIKYLKHHRCNLHKF